MIDLFKPYNASRDRRVVKNKRSGWLEKRDRRLTVSTQRQTGLFVLFGTPRIA